jgi:hypothetical protein
MFVVFGGEESVNRIKGQPGQLTIYRACLESLFPGRGEIFGRMILRCRDAQGPVWAVECVKTTQARVVVVMRVGWEGALLKMFVVYVWCLATRGKYSGLA